MEMEELAELPTGHNELELDETEDWTLDEELPEREEQGLVWKVKKHRRKCILLLAFLILLALITVSITLSLTFALRASTQNHSSHINDPPGDNNAVHFPVGVVIDLGSSGSRVSVYGWNEDNLLQPFPADGPPFYYSFVRGGIANVSPLSEAGENIKPLLEYAARSVAQTGVKLSECPLLVYGTGGLRHLDDSSREEILNSIAEAASEYPFYLPDNWIGVMSGQEEAAYDWISVQQYLLVLEDKGTPFEWDGYESVNTSGCMDMGGSSVEVAFASERPLPTEDYPMESFIDVQYRGEEYDLYAISYPDIGHNAVFTQHQQYLIEDTFGDSGDPRGAQVPDPCLLEDCRFGGIQNTLLYGTGNVSACLRNIHEIIDWTAPCDYGTQCTWNGVYQPDVGDAPFIAFSEFADVALFFGYEGQVPLHEFYDSVVRYCMMNWQDARTQYAHHSLTEIAMAKYCFEGLYIYSFLIGMGFPASSTQVSFHEYLLPSNELNWGLGMMTHFMETNHVHLRASS